MLDEGFQTNFAKAKTSLNNFKQQIEKLKQLNTDNNLYIYEYFLELRNKIDIEREVSKELIDRHYLGLIEEVDKIEAECKWKSVKSKNDDDLILFWNFLF